MGKGYTADQTGTTYKEYAEKGFIDMSHYPILRMHVIKTIPLGDLTNGVRRRNIGTKKPIIEDRYNIKK